MNHTPLDPPLTVGSLPARHPFVDALLDDPGITQLVPTDAPADPTAPLRDQLPPLQQLDVLVTHFGFESHDTAEVRRLVHDAIRARCVVATVVHDLENPHLPAHLQQRHRRQLSLLVDVGLVVATLSEHARERLVRDHDVEPMVLPHPPLGPLVPPRRTAAAGSVLVHLKSLRRNVQARDAVAAMARLAREGAADPVVGIHRDAVVGANLRASLRAAEAAGVEVRVHDPLDHDGLVSLLADVEVLVLPYSHGTHSGLLDLALDLGTKVVAPSTGAYGEQGATTTFCPRDRDVVARLAEATTAALDEPPPPPRDHAARARAFAESRRRFVAALRREVAAVEPVIVRLDPTPVGADRG